MTFKADLIIDDQLAVQTILELGCLEMRFIYMWLIGNLILNSQSFCFVLFLRRSFQNMKPNVLDKKINFEYLEKDVGLKRFFPDKLLLQQKTKNIKKLIVKGMKEYDSYNEEDCMLLYLEKLKNIWRFDEEIYECQLGVCNVYKIFNFSFLIFI
jgi:hypothetical protein